LARDSFEAAEIEERKTWVFVFDLFAEKAATRSSCIAYRRVIQITPAPAGAVREILRDVVNLSTKSQVIGNR